MPQPDIEKKAVLFRHGRRAEDDWQFPAEDAALPESGSIALPKARLLAEWEVLAARNTPLGVVLVSGETLAGLEDVLPRLSLVRLVIPRYADGRLYSIARLLRDRHGFTGEVRAAGDILRDQVALLTRTGFDALEVTHPGTIAALEDNSIVAVRHHYQAAAAQDVEIQPAPATRPWLRISPSVSG